MNKYTKVFTSLLCASLIALPLMVGCGKKNETPDPPEEHVHVDYVSQLHLDMSSETKKQEVRVYLYIDGDTTHFKPVNYNGDEFDISDGTIKARYLAVDTPESTGEIQKWGQTTKNFTHDKLDSADSIIVESDDDKWNFDSTSSHRLMLWVWYRPRGTTEYRNLNIELLQNGFAAPSSTRNTRYGEIGLKALDQAKAEKLHLYSDPSTKDENFYDGEITPLSLKELRCRIKEFVNKSVAVEGIVVAEFGNSVYIESKEADAATGLHYGISLYYGYKPGWLEDVVKMGNYVKVVGKITEFQGTYQISDAHYDPFEPEDETNSIILDEEHTYNGSFAEMTADQILNGTTDVQLVTGTDENGEPVTQTYTINTGDAVSNTTVTVKNLTVDRFTTTSSTTDSNGAISLYCSDGKGNTIVVRTEPFMENGELVTGDRFKGKTINVKGLVEYFQTSGEYQIKVHRLDFIEIQ